MSILEIRYKYHEIIVRMSICFSEFFNRVGNKHAKVMREVIKQMKQHVDNQQ